MLSSAISNKIVSNKVFFILIGAAAAIFLTIYMFTTSTFNLSRIIPGLTYASAFNGVLRVREVYRTTKNWRKAMKVAFGWTGISFLISTLGDWGLQYLLEGNPDLVAKW